MSPSNTAQFARGDVVLVRFPFTDLTSDKRRPAILISDAAARSGADGHFIFVGSSTPPPNEGYVTIDQGSAEAQAMGLRYPTGQSSSYIRPFKIATLDVSMITRRIGAAPPETMERIDSLLRFALGL